MAKLITNGDDIVEIYFESGSARIRFKQEDDSECLISDKYEKLMNLMWHYTNSLDK